MHPYLRPCIMALLCCFATLGFAQGFERPRKALIQYDSIGGQKTTTPTKTEDDKKDPFLEVLQQIGLNVGNNGKPRLTVKAMRFDAEIRKGKHINFYLLSSIPTVNNNNLQEIQKSLGNELQGIYGGLLNSYFSQTFKFNKDETDNEVRGFQIELKGGYRMHETASPIDTTTTLVHTGQAGAEFRYLIPLRKNRNDSALAGNIQLKASFQGLYVGENGAYQNYFKAPDGVMPPKYFFSGTFEASIFVVNEFYLSGGYSFNSVNAIKPFGFLKLTYTKK